MRSTSDARRTVSAVTEPAVQQLGLLVQSLLRLLCAVCLKVNITQRNLVLKLSFFKAILPPPGAGNSLRGVVFGRVFISSLRYLLTLQYEKKTVTANRYETFAIDRQRYWDHAIKFARWQHSAMWRGRGFWYHWFILPVCQLQMVTYFMTQPT